VNSAHILDVMPRAPEVVPFAVDAVQVQVQFSVRAFGSGAATSTPAKYSNPNQ
jgi:hypothetical protein